MARGKKSKGKRKGESPLTESTSNGDMEVTKFAAESDGKIDSSGQAEAADENVEDAATSEVDTHGELLKQLDQAVAQAGESHDRYLRAVAEQENFRKRTLREKEELRKYGPAGFIEDLLSVLDSFNIGLEAARSRPEAASVVEGFEMVRAQFKTAMEQHGVTEIDPDGEVFDPNSHEAVSQQPSGLIEEGKILAVTRLGYRLHDRLLRAATVVVSSGMPCEKEKVEPKEKDVVDPT